MNLTEQNKAAVMQMIAAYENRHEALIEDLTTFIRSQKVQVKPAVKGGKVAIKLENVNKTYEMGKETVHALKNANLEIYEGEIVAIIGPSGSGKSTILNMIGGLDRPTSGTISIHDQQLAHLKDFDLSVYRNQTIGFVFQFFNLQQYLNVRQNVEVPLIFRGERRHEREMAAVEAVQNVGLENRINHLPNQLSGGQMQRVAIARAIVNKPKIILADEPTGNLDKKTGAEILALMKELNAKLNTTIVIVTHDNAVAHQADRIIHVSDGEILS
jgi:ABC-type lipoprotein export system ATPase subunit